MSHSQFQGCRSETVSGRFIGSLLPSKVELSPETNRSQWILLLVLPSDSENGKTCVEKQYSVTDAKNELKDRASAFATTFMQAKLRVVDIAITNEGKVNAKLWECVEQIKTAGTKHFKHGKCKSLRKYLAETGKKRSDVDPELIDSRTNAAGITKEFIKCYDDDSSEWEFADEEYDGVQGRQCLDNSTYKLDDDHRERVYKNAVMECFSGSMTQAKAAKLTMADVNGSVQKKESAQATVKSEKAQNQDNAEAEAEAQQKTAQAIQEKVDGMTPMQIQIAGGYEAAFSNAEAAINNKKTGKKNPTGKIMKEGNKGGRKQLQGKASNKKIIEVEKVMSQSAVPFVKNVIESCRTFELLKQQEANAKELCLSLKDAPDV